MRVRFGVILSLCAFLLLGLLSLPARSVRAADLWEVQVAGDVAAEGIMANAYFPGNLTIHAGDTVRWTWATGLAPHTVTFLSGSSLPHTVTYANGTAAPDLLSPGPAAGAMHAGAGFFPSGAVGADNSGSFDGTKITGSGVPLAADTPPFRLTFTQPGVYPYVSVTQPGMQGSVTVLPTGASLIETPAQAAARGQAEFAALVSALRKTLNGLNAPQAAAAPSTHLVAAGVSVASGISALSFLPGNLTVHHGDQVVWAVEDPLEVHTVTFTSGAPPPGFIEVTPQPSGPPSVVVPANVFSPVGDGTYTGTGYVNSGVFGPGGGFFLVIDAPAGTYEYLCLIHGPTPMKGTITVVE